MIFRTTSNTFVIPDKKLQVHHSLEETEKLHIEEVLHENHHNISQGRSHLRSRSQYPVQKNQKVPYNLFKYVTPVHFVSRSVHPARMCV